MLKYWREHAWTQFLEKWYHKALCPTCWRIRIDDRMERLHDTDSREG